MIKNLNWDSDFFGYKVGRIDIGNEELPLPQMDDYKLIYGFSNELIPNWEKYLYDKKTTYFQDLLDESEFNYTLNITEFQNQKHNYLELLNLAYASGEYSRFYLDKNFKRQEFQRLYKRWIDNSIEKVSDYKIFVAEDGEKIIGFITVGKKNDGLSDIGLLAVSSEARGKRVATQLIQFAKEFSLKHNLNKLQVVTQLDNTPACKLYEKTGFKIKEINYIYHFWNHDTI